MPKATTVDHPEKPVRNKLKKGHILKNRSTVATTAIALVMVPYITDRPAGGWVRFYVKNTKGQPVGIFVETLSMSPWDYKNTGVGA